MTKNVLGQYLMQKQKKQKCIQKYLGLEKIDNDINTISIYAIKSVLTQKDPKAPQKLKSDLSNLKKQKVELLQKYGKTEEDLAPHFECPNCQDTGYIQTENGVTLCPCIKQRLYNIQYNLQIVNRNAGDLGWGRPVGWGKQPC